MVDFQSACQRSVLIINVFPIRTAFATQDTGSTRQAIHLLRKAGELAQANDFETVIQDQEYPRNRRGELEKNQLYEGIQELTTQGHAVLCVLAYHQSTMSLPASRRFMNNI